MKKLKALIFTMLVMSALASAQENNKVTVFYGRQVPYESQKIMDISYQNLKNVPTVDSKVEILILDNNNLEKLPSWIGSLKNLRVLSVRNNNLTDFNSAISFCENLEQLYLSGNKPLSDLPNMSFCKLKIIDVVGTSINEVPGWVNSLDSLYCFKYSTK
jgi:Leucine-rich repeat (LRR) protein